MSIRQQSAEPPAFLMIGIVTLIAVVSVLAASGLIWVIANVVFGVPAPFWVCLGGAAGGLAARFALGVLRQRA